MATSLHVLLTAARLRTSPQKSLSVCSNPSVACVRLMRLDLLPGLCALRAFASPIIFGRGQAKPRSLRCCHRGTMKGRETLLRLPSRNPADDPELSAEVRE